MFVARRGPRDLTRTTPARTGPQWIAAEGSGHDLNPSRIAVAGDSLGGTMSAALTLMG